MIFQVVLDALPRDFFREEPVVDNHKHLLFYRVELLQHLTDRKVAYIDGTFKIAPEPIMQLLTSFSFVRNHAGKRKQFPFIYVMMVRS